MFPEIGKDTSAHYIAYGDDSSYEEILLYGFVICRRENIFRLEKDILFLKREFGIPNDIPIHMRKLLSGDYRKKYGITKLDRIRQPIFFRKIVNIVNKNNCITRFCYTVIPESGKLLKEAGEMDVVRFVENHKAIIHQMAAACFCPYIENNTVVLSPNDFEVYISEDKTKIKYAEGMPKRQAHYLAEALIPITNPVQPGEFYRLRPNIQSMKGNLYLQFADAVVYMLTHALSKKCTEDSFSYQLSRIKYLIRHTLVTENNQEELGVQLPAG